jgi:hypothetical protein
LRLYCNEPWFDRYIQVGYRSGELLLKLLDCRLWVVALFLIVLLIQQVGSTVELCADEVYLLRQQGATDLTPYLPTAERSQPSFACS